MNHNRNIFAAAVILSAWAATVLCVMGCGGRAHNSDGAAVGAGATSATSVALKDKSGAQLWSENCAHCHNLRPPNEFSQREWDIIVHHMRVRATLTGDESRKIVAFLKAAD